MPHGPPICDEELRSMARERIADGRLPIIFPRSMHAGYGSGTTCQVCAQPIEPFQIEYEITASPDNRLLSFHLACHAIWQLECRAWDLARRAG
jgi:hypothetical protein